MIIKNQNNHNYFSEKEKMEKYQEYIQALEQEHKKIQVFQRELPLCLELVTQAIETCKKKISGTPSNDFDLNGVQSECSEQTSSDVRPVFEEFIPIKKAASSHSDSVEQESKNPTNLNSFDVNENNSKKSDWLNSVQLWNQTPDPPSKEDSLVKRNGSGGAFHPFKKEKSVSNGDMADPPAKRTVDGSAPPASTAETGDGNNKKEEKAGQRKSRRSWSPELHRRFVQALQQLGGSHVATPKQIREFMKVDGLTNDEVKSHLQKFRLHTRRPAPSINNNSTQTTQFVVVGGIFLPPEYAAVAATTTAETGESSVTKPKGIYASIATLPPPFIEAPVSSPKRRKQSNSDDRGSSHSEGRSHSQTLSESTHMTADSPAY